TVGEELNPSTAVCHFEKAMPQFHGLAQLINQWFAKNNLADFAYINREQDLGIPGLRKAKESYFPERLVEKVRIVLDGAGMEKAAEQKVCG
ncbi:MAG: phosphatidylglycerol lysyltransferase domain-containing protein, partial [Desulfurivibrionaceae bacterium]